MAFYYNETYIGNAIWILTMCAIQNECFSKVFKVTFIAERNNPFVIFKFLIPVFDSYSFAYHRIIQLKHKNFLYKFLLICSILISNIIVLNDIYLTLYADRNLCWSMVYMLVSFCCVKVTIGYPVWSVHVSINSFTVKS